MEFKPFLLSGLVLMAFASSKMNAQDPKFMRSSIYSILVNSDEQNQRLDKEAQSTDPQGYAETLKGTSINSLGEVPKLTFQQLAIPEQFNNHNLDILVIDFDKLAAGISEEDAKLARPKGGGAGKFLKATAASAVSSDGESSIIRVEKVDDYMHAVVQKFLDENKVAPMMVAKWYSYNDSATPKFNHNLIMERGLENASGSDLAKASANDELKAQLSAQGFELLNNTFVVATNLRFRNNKALAKEISDMVGAAAASAGSQMGGLGGLAALGAKKAAEAATNALMKDMYSVSAVTNLYKLKWNEDIDRELSDKVLYNDDASLNDLLSSGLCVLEYVGQTKARAGVKKDKEKTIDQLASTATARAIDKALAKLQVEYDEFRTNVPVSKSEDGFIYAKIGTKEGVMAGDEYDILEQQLDTKTNKINYKKVGTAKVEKDAVWFNTTGADELIVNAEEKEAKALKEAQDLGYTKFKAGKKDYSGYYLRLAKKKGKIED